MRLLPILALAGAAFYVYRALEARRRSGARRIAAQPADEAIGSEVRARLAGIAAPGAVRVGVVQGVVSLRGSVSRAERDRLLRAALAVPGVKSVTNLLDAQGADPGLAVESGEWEGSANPR